MAVVRTEEDKAIARASHQRRDVPRQDIDLSDAGHYRSGFPHQLFARFRRESPIFYHPACQPGTELEIMPFWVVTRHADIRAMSRDAETYSSVSGPMLYNRHLRGTSIPEHDGEAHRTKRGVVAAWFTPRRVERLAVSARKWAGRIVDKALEKGEVDFVGEMAHELPMHVIADVLGVPIEDREWLFAKTQQSVGGNPDTVMPSAYEVYAYGADLCRRKAKAPEDDILSQLGQLQASGDGVLSPDELTTLFTTIATAGSETTQTTIAIGMTALFDHPAELAALRADPTLSGMAADEIIRWASPVPYFQRRVMRDASYGEHRFREGEHVTLWYPSGNFDEQVFDQPFRFDIRRKDNPHVTFGGGGPHLCLGLHLARREVQIFFEELLARTRGIEPAGEAHYAVFGFANPMIGTLHELPVRLAAA